MTAARRGRPEPSTIGNRLLASLPERERARFSIYLHRVPLKLKQVLYRQGDPIDRVYFPDSGVISLVSVTGDGKSVEVGTIGNEGAVGIHALYSSTTMPCEAVVQAKGEAHVLTIEDLDRAGDVLVDLLGKYSQALLIQTMQTAACHSLHSIRQRAARWILMMHDRTQADRFPLTQEFLATMLGVRRSSVTLVARSLQHAGLIGYRHGKMAIQDRAKLEAASCECYQVVQDQFDRLLPSLARRTNDDADAAPPHRRSQVLTDLIPFLS